MQVSHLFHPITRVASPDQLFLRVAFSCYCRSLRLAGGTIPFAPALALLGTPRGSIVTSRSELRTWHAVELHTLGDLYDDGKLIPFPALLGRFWGAVVGCLSECVSRPVQFIWESCILGLFPRDARNRAAARFLDLGLITAKRLITRRWKSSDPPFERAWKSSFEVWAGAEGVALAREDALGLRKYPLSISWEAMLVCLRGLGQTSDVEVAV
ncbi:hypothetical protein NDU88_001553 [Pleurodeles waltl]|uniref:Uncharacterized protein n=1 Tax=Pleurodeles waltl TaxID=8319 RepID=A0AAV7PCU8_PLEWA|nr:hypothetical protein NDU88_001553 [Pleurodeles waltl]